MASVTHVVVADFHMTLRAFSLSGVGLRPLMTPDNITQAINALRDVATAIHDSCDTLSRTIDILSTAVDEVNHTLMDLKVNIPLFD